LDKDGIAKLFIIKDGETVLVDHETWLELTEHLQLNPGGMPRVYLMPGFRPNTADRLDHLEKVVYAHLGTRH
jgi:hypothetical protein